MNKTDNIHSETDLSLIPHTGQTKALFFNSVHAINLRQAIDRYIPGQLEIIKGKDNMRQAMENAGLSTPIPEVVPWFQPKSEYGLQLPTPRIAMVITDLEEEMFQSMVSRIAQDAAGEFSGRQEKARQEDPYRDSQE